MAQGPQPFQGFPASAEATAIPRLFFSAVLPNISRVEELLVTLYFFFAQGRVRGRHPPYVAGRELAADVALMQALASFCPDPQAALAQGLALAVQRGTLLRAETEEDDQGLYLLNTAANRALSRLGRVEVGEPCPCPPAGAVPAGTALPAAEGAARPNIFALYEENIGAITAIIADELRDAEGRYPWEWIAAAFREAVAMNKRSWRYIQAILQRWEAEGPDYEALGRDPEAAEDRRRSLFRRYRYLIRR